MTTPPRKPKGSQELSPHDIAVDLALMNETKAYVDRGRQHAAADVETLRSMWVTAFRELVRELRAPPDPARQREFADLDAEFQLRGLSSPHDQVQAELAALGEELRRLGPDAMRGAEADISRAIRDFLDERDKPPN